jgi:hypothetical protein
MLALFPIPHRSSAKNQQVQPSTGLVSQLVQIRRTGYACCGRLQRADTGPNPAESDLEYGIPVYHHCLNRVTRPGQCDIRLRVTCSCQTVFVQATSWSCIPLSTTERSTAVVMSPIWIVQGCKMLIQSRSHDASLMHPHSALPSLRQPERPEAIAAVASMASHTVVICNRQAYPTAPAA